MLCKCEQPLWSGGSPPILQCSCTQAISDLLLADTDIDILFFCVDAGWIYQDTFVDLRSLEPVLAEAFAAAGVARRAPALPFVENFKPPAERVLKLPVAEEAPEAAPAKAASAKAADEPNAPAKKPDSAKKRKEAASAPAPDAPWTGIVCHGNACR